MFYTYILLSEKSHIFYYGYTHDVAKRLQEHNSKQMKSTSPHVPWKLVWYAGFTTEKEAKDFEQYLKSGSGKAFAYKRLVKVALAEDVILRKVKGIPKP
ncbi:MAG: GIY-YIG nuclease family protein [Weeksellaceae bacterium]